MHHQQQRGGVVYGQQSVQQAPYDSRSVLSYCLRVPIWFYSTDANFPKIRRIPIN